MATIPKWFACALLEFTAGYISAYKEDCVRRAESCGSAVRTFLFLVAGVETSFLLHQLEGSHIYVGGSFSWADYSLAFTTRNLEPDTR